MTGVETLPDLVAAAVERYSKRVAFEEDGRTLSYGELDRIGASVARKLAKAGVGNGSRVAIFAEKSMEAIAAIIGTLRVGACYVPLDPMAPIARLTELVTDCAPAAVATDKRHLEKLWCLGRPSATCLLLEKSSEDKLATRFVWREARNRSKPSSPQDPRPHDPAYILYTSGSTGRPKGVEISHSAAVNFVRWASSEFRLAPGDRVGCPAPLGFDLSVFDLFASLHGGATTVLIPRELLAFPMALSRFIERSRMTVWYSVPSILVDLVERGQLQQRTLPSLRCILFAGEVFAAEPLGRLMQAVPSARCFNLYGPTETNVCTFYPVETVPSPGFLVPIGRACAGMTVFAVTDEGEVASPGEGGQLYVGGPSLMLRYWNRPDETSRTLVKDPRGGTGVVYRTGDRVLVVESGDYVFRGRTDQMIKRRGYRIEPGEIQAALSGHGSVRECGVVATRGERSVTEIIAVVVVRGDAEIIDELNAHLKSRLPRYMIPDRIEFRSRLPRTRTGKLDRHILRKWIQKGPVS